MDVNVGMGGYKEGIDGTGISVVLPASVPVSVDVDDGVLILVVVPVSVAYMYVR